MKISLFKKKYCYRPTIPGAIIILGAILSLLRLSMPAMHSFLSLDKAVDSQTMILEGWVSSYALTDLIKYYEANNYKHLIVTGIPITQYEYASDFNYTSQATIQALNHFGFNDTIYEASIPTNIYQDRTYSTALTAKEIFEAHPGWDKSFNVYSMGVHSRRSLLLFKKAFGGDYKIGVISHSVRTYIGNKWWTSSVGFRTVTNEMLAYFYAGLFFYPDEKDYLTRIDRGKFFDKHRNERSKKQFEFTDTLTSPFNKEEISHHKKFNYFDISPRYVAKAKFSLDTSHAVFEMPTTTSRKPLYRIYGHLDFNLDDTMLNLTAYQNMEFINHPVYGNSLFVPFTDLTNGNTTYAGGRYLDLRIPETDSVELDFNSAYNPYCAYSERWSCPLVPFGNHLNINIKAGEKRYKHAK